MNVIPRFAEFLHDQLDISIPKIGCEEFDLLLDFVASGGVSIRPIFAAMKSEIGLTTSWDPISFFSLAEKLELHNLQNLIMDTIIQYHKKARELPNPDFASRAYQETRQGSAISQYALRGVRYSLKTEKDGDGSATYEVNYATKSNDHPSVDI